jgi:hypothetical protein
MTGYLKWQNSKFFLVNESSEYHIDNIEKINRDDAGYIEFGIGKKWQIAYLNSKRTKCIFLFSEDGIHWEKYPEGPENNHIDVNEDSYLIYPHFNSVAILKRQKKLFYIYIDNNWKIFPIPDSINYIDIETDKSFLAVGSKPPVRVYNSKMEIACFQKRKNSDSWNEVPIIMKSWWNASKTIKMGGFDQLQYADTRKIPYLFTSECAWWLDDPSWFLFIEQEDGTFYAHRLKNLQIDM